MAGLRFRQLRVSDQDSGEGKLLDDQAHTYAEHSPAFDLQVVQPVLLENLSLVGSVKDDMLVARRPLAGST